MIKAWIEAMRLRTLPVSVAGVIAGCAYAAYYGRTNCIVAVLCLFFAILAQISSNFANEYYDYAGGLDRKGREGPRRGVTEGDISPRAMKTAAFLTLGAACATGLTLLLWGPWWLILVGIAIAFGVLAYSTGPYPLSHHGLGEVAVVFFFGLIPVNFTYYVQAGNFDPQCLLGSVSIGLMGANVLIVNNYRDRYDDASVGKTTLALLIGEKGITTLYLFNGYIAVALMVDLWLRFPLWTWLAPALYLTAHTMIWLRLKRCRGSRLNPLLGMTAMAMLIYAILFFIIAL